MVLYLWEMLEVHILHTWLWGMWPTVCLCLWVGLVHQPSLIINQSSLICSDIHGRSRLGFISWPASTAMQERGLLLQAIPLCSLGPRPNQPHHKLLVLWTQKEGHSHSDEMCNYDISWINEGIQGHASLALFMWFRPYLIALQHAVFDSPAACRIW